MRVFFRAVSTVKRISEKIRLTVDFGFCCLCKVTVRRRFAKIRLTVSETKMKLHFMRFWQKTLARRLIFMLVMLIMIV